ncbi:YtpI family protein [Salinicoccus albus]|uniref:YtpI family protein n=1 Tax=Salinicoccus albus TaxID=418756 RepID=UPI00036DFC73|nr:YtpI family protein [Salinicoccus albus]
MEFLYQLSVSILVTFLLLCLFMFIIYKIRQAKTKRDVRTAYYNSISRIWLGLLILTFGLNTIVQFSTAVAYIVGPLFILLGAMNARHFNAARKYFKGNLPIEEKAWEEFNKQKSK